jgi:hypothetical protein
LYFFFWAFAMVPSNVAAGVVTRMDQGDGVEKKFALIVSVDRYAYAEFARSTRSIFAAATWSADLLQAFVNQGYHTTLLRGDHADRRTLVSELARLSTVADADDVVVTVIVADVLTDVRKNTDYLAVYDTRPEDLEADALRLQYVIDLLGESAALKRLLATQLTSIAAFENLMTKRNLGSAGFGDRKRLLDTIGRTAEGNGTSVFARVQLMEEEKYGEAQSLLRDMRDALLGGASNRGGPIEVEELLTYLEEKSPRRSSVISIAADTDSKWIVANTDYETVGAYKTGVVATLEVAEQYKKVVSSWRVEGLLTRSTSFGLYYLLDHVVGKSIEDVNPSCLDLFSQVEPLLAQAVYQAHAEQRTSIVKQDAPKVKAGEYLLAKTLEDLMNQNTQCQVEWKSK